MQYIITRHYDDGTAKAKITTKSGYKDEKNDDYDQYVESVREGGNYKNLLDWCCYMGIVEFDIILIKLSSKNSDCWTDITKYC